MYETYREMNEYSSIFSEIDVINLEITQACTLYLVHLDSIFPIYFFLSKLFISFLYNTIIHNYWNKVKFLKVQTFPRWLSQAYVGTVRPTEMKRDKIEKLNTVVIRIDQTLIASTTTKIVKRFTHSLHFIRFYLI